MKTEEKIIGAWMFGDPQSMGTDWGYLYKDEEERDDQFRHSGYRFLMKREETEEDFILRANKWWGWD